jgi:S1-C subfamily serine protease
VCEKVLPSIFRVITYHNGAQVGIATGFFIRENGTALTA